jgi:hypothetical protein
VKDFYARGISITALICAGSFLLTASPGPSLAQRGSPGATAAGRRTETLNRQGEQHERDKLSREGTVPENAPGGHRRAQDLAEQVKRDFEGLQAAYNRIVLAMAPGERPDFDSILDSVNEVKRCAARLKANLALPRVGIEQDKARSEAAAAQMEESLRMLRKHIYSFVTNPLFEATPAFDAEQAGKAGRDLDIILELSEGIRRSGKPKGRQD